MQTKFVSIKKVSLAVRSKMPMKLVTEPLLGSLLYMVRLSNATLLLPLLRSCPFLQLKLDLV
jgi:hypothetical protein